MLKNVNKTIEDSLSVLNDKELDNSSFVNIDYLEYVIENKLYGIIDALFYLIKVEYIFEVNKNYEALLPMIQNYYRENNIDLNLNTAKIYTSLQEYWGLDELNLFVKTSSIEQILNNRISLIRDSETDLLYKKQYIETLSEYIKKINPFETNKIIKENKKSLFKKSLLFNLSFIVALTSFLVMVTILRSPDKVFETINIYLQHENLKFIAKNLLYDTFNILLIASVIPLVIYSFRSNIVKGIALVVLIFSGCSIMNDLQYEYSIVFAKPKTENITFDKVSIFEGFKSQIIFKKGEIKNEEGITTKEYIWPDNIKLKKGVKYDVKHYNNLIVDIKEVK